MIKAYQHMGTNDLQVTRRRFLHTSAGRLAGLAGILAMRIAPSSAQAREVSMLSWAHFVPQADQQLSEIGKRFTQATKISIRFDHLQEPQMAAKLAAEVQTGSGHDLLMLRMHLPQLHATNLADMTDVVDLLVKQYGPMYDFCRDAAYYKDHWVAMPAGHRPCSLAAAVPVVAPVQTRIRLCVAQVATSRWLPRDPRRVHTDDQRVGGDPILSGASAPWTPARPSTPAWPGVRTPAARRAVVRAAVPEAADGQSVDRSGSLQLSLRFLDAGLRRSSLR